MHLDIALDQLGFPPPRLAGQRTPVEGLYLSGAGAAPVAGIAGTPGRLAARAVLRDDRRRQRRPNWWSELDTATAGPSLSGQ